MSTLVLNGSCELQMPSSFVDIDREEMEYVDGGGELAYLNNRGLKAVLLACALNPVGATILGLAYWKAVSLVTAKFALLCGKLGAIGGIVGSVAGFVLGGLAAISVATTVCDALYNNQGLSFGYSWRPYIEAK